MSSPWQLEFNMGILGGHNPLCPNRVMGYCHCIGTCLTCVTWLFCQPLISGYIVASCSRCLNPRNSPCPPFLQTKNFQNWGGFQYFVNMNRSTFSVVTHIPWKREGLIDFMFLVPRFFSAVQLVQNCMNFLMTMYLFHRSHCRKWMSSTSF